MEPITGNHTSKQQPQMMCNDKVPELTLVLHALKLGLDVPQL